METKADLVASISRAVQELGARFAEQDVDEWAHMRGLCSATAAEALDGMSVQALHLLDHVPATEEEDAVNVVGLARATGTPKGTVSKLLQRMEAGGVVIRYRRQGNRKEVLLRLTGIGEEIRAAHRSLHDQMGAVADGFLSRYTRAELETLLRVLDDLLRMPREGLRFRPDLLG